MKISSYKSPYIIVYVLHRFDRDWKKIEDFVGSKTVIQVQLYE